jgi:REP element-mobilizing transposase RayT
VAWWLLTWTAYGTWRPGDRRGSTLRVPDGTGHRTFEPVAGDTPRAEALARSASRLLKGAPVRLTNEQAAVTLRAIRSQASFREWELRACAVMANHVHAVLGVGDVEEPSRALSAFKAYASRDLNHACGRPASGTWWTQSGSTRRLRSEPNVLAAVRYVRDQPCPLAVWLAPNFVRRADIGP